MTNVSTAQAERDINFPFFRALIDQLMQESDIRFYKKVVMALYAISELQKNCPADAKVGIGEVSEKLMVLCGTDYHYAMSDGRKLSKLVSMNLIDVDQHYVAMKADGFGFLSVAIDLAEMHRRYAVLFQDLLQQPTCGLQRFKQILPVHLRVVPSV